MNKLEQVFAKGKAFIPFVTAGDPSPATTEKLVVAMAEAGADLIELGIPFSDPVAEGPVIQAADNRALARGVTTDHVFEMVKNIRRSCNVPIVLMTYANPVFSYGTGKFLEQCRETGIDALIIPDVPFEEREEFLPYCRQHGVALISMIAPTSSGNRIQMIAKEAEGFIYCVSSLGVTGVREELGSETAEMVKKVKEVRDIPCAVGFGIGTPEQAAQMAAAADGIIVGSAIVKIVEDYGEDCLPRVVEYVRKMKEAIS